MDKFIHIRSSKFPVLPGEKEELVNDGMYGKALGLYLQQRLGERGFDSPFVCCEDWGWWVAIRAPFSFGVCIYSGEPVDGPNDYACACSPHSPRQWSWKRCWFVDTEPWSQRLHQALLDIFDADEEITLLGVSDDFVL